MEEEKRRRQAAEKQADATEKQAEAARLGHSKPSTAPLNDEGRNNFEPLDVCTYGDATVLGAQDKIRTLMLYQCYHTYHYHYH